MIRLRQRTRTEHAQPERTQTERTQTEQTQPEQTQPERTQTERTRRGIHRRSAGPSGGRLAGPPGEPGGKPAQEPPRQEPPARKPQERPDSPTDLGGHSWWEALRGTVREFQDDQLTDRAAALTYYGVLSLFPALLVLVSLVGLAGKDLAQTLVTNLTTMVPAQVRDIISEAVTNLQNSQGAGLVAIAGLALAIWTASGYVAAFMRAANAIYEVEEGRPIWKTTPVRLGVTVLLIALGVISAATVVLSGTIAERVGAAFGLSRPFVAVWDLLRWPVVLLLVSFMIALLYWASPNVRQRGFGWVTPGSLIAVVVWVVASAGFGFYVSNFGSYNKTYGTIAGVIVFLIWLWISNIAILLGVEFDAELQRRRAIAAGHPPRQEPFVEPRDTRAMNGSETG